MLILLPLSGERSLGESSDSLQDVVSSLDPDVRLGIAVAHLEKFVDGRFQGGDTTVRATANLFLRQLCEHS
jgi:hypothetical protein